MTTLVGISALRKKSPQALSQVIPLSGFYEIFASFCKLIFFLDSFEFQTLEVHIYKQTNKSKVLEPTQKASDY